MDIKKLITFSIMSASVAISANAVTPVLNNKATTTDSSQKSMDDAKDTKGWEKCYGVVKKGMNDCGSKPNGHSCKGHASEDGNKDEWISLPKGICEKLVNGSTMNSETKMDSK